MYLNIDIRLPGLEANTGDDGYYVIADAHHSGSWLCHFNQRDDAEVVNPQDLMRVFGVKKEFCIIGIVTGMWYRFSMVTGVRGGKYYTYPRIHLFGRAPDEDIEITFIRLRDHANYCDMAKAYRAFQLQSGRCVPLTEKIQNRPELAYAKDAVEIRIRMAWKPAPPTVLEQTPENEPELYVACTFDRVKDLIDELKTQEVDKAEICLVGWNKSGHDGRWPQTFPVEEWLGGEQKLRELIAYAQQQGYLITCHTNSTVAYTIADCWNEDLILKDKDGRLALNNTPWSGGDMYHLCPQKAWELAQDTLPKVAGLGFRGLHYIDVMSVVELRSCFDKKHPLTPKQTLAYHEKIMELAQKHFGGISSEGAFDFASKYLDYGLYLFFDHEDENETFFDEKIPFYALVYHGLIMYNPSSGTMNFTIKDREQMLKMVEYGGRPAFYLYSNFYGGNAWMGTNDLSCGTEEELKYAVEKIKEGYGLYKQIRRLQAQTIEQYKVLSGGMRKITYADGTVVSVDYGDESWDMV